MSNSLRFNMPFVDAAQAQKHVTVNEALARIDALAAGRVETRGGAVPPGAPADGEVHITGDAPTGAWAGQPGRLAIFSNGGWEFVAPWAGARAWVVSEGRSVVFNGTAWLGEASGASPTGAATLSEVVTIDHAVAAGPVSVVAGAIPDKAIVLGVTGRVTEEIGGAAGWKLGVSGGADRYGSGIGVALNAYVHGVSGSPLAYYGDTDLVLTAEGADFAGGRVLLAVHLQRLVPPAAV